MSDPCKQEAQIGKLVQLVEDFIDLSKSEIRELKEMNGQFKKLLYGNGEIGLKTEVHILKSQEEKRQKYLVLVWGSFGSAFAALLLSLFKVTQ